MIAFDKTQLANLQVLVWPYSNYSKTNTSVAFRACCSKVRVFFQTRDRLTDDDCIGTTFLSLHSISGQGDEGIFIITYTDFDLTIEFIIFPESSRSSLHQLRTVLTGFFKHNQESMI